MDRQALSSILQQGGVSTPPNYSTLMKQIKPLPPGYLDAFLNTDIFYKAPISSKAMTNTQAYSTWKNFSTSAAVPFNYDMGAFVTDSQRYFVNTNTKSISTGNGLTIIIGSGPTNSTVLSYGGINIVLNTYGQVAYLNGIPLSFGQAVSSGITYYSFIYTPAQRTLSLSINNTQVTTRNNIGIGSSNSSRHTIGGAGNISDVVVYETALTSADLSSAIAVLTYNWSYAQDVIDYLVSTGQRQKAVFLFNKAMSNVKQQADQNISGAKKNFTDAYADLAAALAINDANLSSFPSAAIDYTPIIANYTSLVPTLQATSDREVSANQTITAFTKQNPIDPDRAAKIQIGDNTL